jgi:anti-sigma factor RsiW
VTGRFDAAEAFAYVDNCLGPTERRAFEARLREDAALRRQVALWESQNGAIRAAYGAAGSPRAAIDLGRNSNENAPVWMAAAAQTRRVVAASASGGEARVWRPRAEMATISRSAPSEEVWPRLSLGRGLLAIAVFVAAMLTAGAPNGLSWPRDKLIASGVAAYRAFAAPAALTPVEFRASDPEALTKWFMPQFARGVVAPRLAPSGLTLLGGRIAPGTTASAAFLVYQDARGGRVGLLIEPLDAPPPSKPTLRQSDGLNVAAWTDAGRGLVAVGADRDSVATLIRLVDGAVAARG